MPVRGVPGTVIASGTSPIQFDNFHLWSFAITPTTLNAGQRYWLTLTGTDGNYVGYWESALNSPSDLGDVFGSPGNWTRLKVPNSSDRGDGNSDH
ncbi:MAG: hypothetical protein ACR2M1_09885 [Gemmatimonadaceae bacterium]